MIDAGNGTAGIVAGPLLRDLGCVVEELYCEVDGRFPNHFPDPTIPEYLKDLIDRVKATRADVGIGYDGDADRIGVVDDQGQYPLGGPVDDPLCPGDFEREKRGHLCG